MSDSSEMLLVSSSVSDDGSQKCHLGPSVFKTLNLKLGQCVTIKHRNSNYICKAWVRKDKRSTVIDFDHSVYSTQPTDITPQLNPKYLSIDSLTPQRTLHFKGLSIDIIVKISSYVQKFNSSDDSVRETVLRILDSKYLLKNSIVDLGGHRISNIHRIHIKDTVPESAFGFVAQTTHITINKVFSRERFDAINKEPALLGGLSRQIKLLRSMIEVPLLKASALKNLCRSCPKSVLLHGPPGCGKTSLAQRVAYECGAVLLSVNCADVIGSRPGETEAALQKYFNNVTVYCTEGPTVMLFDEIDSFCGKKSTNKRVISQLTQILDQAQSVENVVVIGTTNRPTALDPALRRPGRFDREIFIGIPSQEQKVEILETLLHNFPVEREIDKQWLAEATPGYVGADLKALLQQAFYIAIERSKNMQDKLSVTKQDLHGALHVTLPTSQRGSDVFLHAKPVRWEDIGGLEEVKAQVKQAIELPLTHPEAFTRLGLPRPKGVLLYGPPGCAKTTLVRAAATSCHVTFLSISGAQLYSPFVGDSERKIAEVFQQARAGAPCILFIDEIDSVVGSRSRDSAMQGGVQERVLSTLLNEMDGVGLKVDSLQSTSRFREAEGENLTNQPCHTEIKVDNNEVLVVAATNRPDKLDDALIRPGRIDKIIYVPTPDVQAREEILRVHCKKIIHQDSAPDLSWLAERTKDFSGADLENLYREAALHAMTVDGLDCKEVTKMHFNHVLAYLRPTLDKAQLEKYSSLKLKK